MKKINVEIEGTTPLLMNRFLDKQLADKIKKRTGAVKEIPPEEKLYLTEKGKPYVPSLYLEGCLRESAKQFKIPGKGKATYSKIVGATVSVEPGCIVIDGGWEPFRIAAVNPNTRGRVMVTRPMFNEWSLSFDVICEDESVDINSIQNILEHGGKFVGIGDWRPDKKGKFGKFRIASIKEAKD